MRSVTYAGCYERLASRDPTGVELVGRTICRDAQREATRQDQDDVGDRYRQPQALRAQIV
jgi:hypothetical protein